MTDSSYRDLKILGTHAPLPDSPEAAVLERVPNPHPGDIYLVRFTAPEFRFSRYGTNSAYIPVGGLGSPTHRP